MSQRQGFGGSNLWWLVLFVAFLGACRRHRPSHSESSHRFLLRAKKAMSEGDLSSAIEAYRSAVDKAPHSAEAWNRLGLALEYRFYETGDDAFRDEALAAYRKAGKQDRNCLVCLVNEATLLWNSGDKKGAARLYEKILGKAPDHPDAGSMRKRIQIAETSPLEESKQKGERK